MKLVNRIENCGEYLKRSTNGPVYFKGLSVIWGDNEITMPAPLDRIVIKGSYFLCNFKGEILMKAAKLDNSEFRFMQGSRDFIAWTIYTKGNEDFLFTAQGYSYRNRVFVVDSIFEYSIATQTERLLAKDFEWTVSASKDGRHYGHKGHGVPCIGQLDFNLNVLWEIDEATLREYGKVDEDDPRSEKFAEDCKVGNIQVFGDTLYYMYNFSMIIALDAHTGAFKRRFSRFPADHHSTYVNPLNGVECSLMRDIDALHGGRYIEELHAFVIVRQEHLIEIDYETLTARARPIHVHHLWKYSLTTTGAVVTMIGKDRVAVHAQESKDVAILDYHTLEVLDYLRLDEDNPGGYLRGSLYHDGKLYVLTTAPSSAVKGCTLYEVEVDG